MSYEAFVASRFKDMGSLNQNLMHAAAGVSGEAGEVLDIIKKIWAYNKPLDIPHLMEEVGDLVFYITALCNELGVNIEEIKEQNVEKLTARYPQGYSDKDALARKDKVNERST